jgi:hypothetical protein
MLEDVKVVVQTVAIYRTVTTGAMTTGMACGGGIGDVADA